MKLLIIFFVFSLFLSNAYSSQDSVAFFYREDKVIVLINERLEAGNRLNDFLDSIGAGDTFEIQTEDQGISFSCGRGMRGTSCKFVFSPSKNVTIQDRSLQVITTSDELRLPSRNFYMNFAGSMNDRFSLKMNQDGIIEMTGSKKLGAN